MGDAFTIVTPAYLLVYINDPDTVLDCPRRKSWRAQAQSQKRNLKGNFLR